MDTSLSSYSRHHHVVDDEYIDMELFRNSPSKLLCYSTNSPPLPLQSRGFEFHVSSSSSSSSSYFHSHDSEPTPSPPDQLFYKGNLLPIHLPPRLQMVQNLLNSPTSTSTIPFPLQSSSSNKAIMPASESSYRPSFELNPNDYFFQWSTELSSFSGEYDHPHHHHHSKKSWSKKLKQSSICQKLKASKGYLKSLFVKPDSSDDPFAKPTYNVNKAPKRAAFNSGLMEAYPTLGFGMDSANHNNHRKSFSGAIRRHSPAKYLSSSSSGDSSSSSSSSSFSYNANGYYELQFLKRSSSATSEFEGSIEEAIAHCKMSQQILHSR